jgi:hypothetical protein
VERISTELDCLQRSCFLGRVCGLGSEYRDEPSFFEVSGRGKAVTRIVAIDNDRQALNRHRPDDGAGGNCGEY